MADEKTGREKPVPVTPMPEGAALETIRKLVDLMEQHGLVEVEVEQADMAVRLRKGGAEATAAPVPVVAAALAQPAPAPKAAEAPAASINSPMVGTFYASSSPEADAYVKVGDHVAEDTVVCVIEAMKVFNEIRAEMSGSIEKILAKNTQAVEFGQPLFAVRPD
ncbi:MAG: acetyl-CoA carboxylase biotin carboxyl carrier protein [Phycisphaerae bacterium]|nr:acetyl-CoA carboxylase biotin carboxyl carrier protein [Phycisphaerae bacterium]